MAQNRRHLKADVVFPTNWPVSVRIIAPPFYRGLPDVRTKKGLIRKERSVATFQTWVTIANLHHHYCTHYYLSFYTGKTASRHVTLNFTTSTGIGYGVNRAIYFLFNVAQRVP